MRLAELELPATPEFVSLARLIVSSIADDRYELTDDQLHNLKLAVSEACVLVIESQPAGADAHVGIRCKGGPDRLEVSVLGPGMSWADSNGDGRVVDPDRSHVTEVGMPLIGSLVDDVSVQDDGGGKALRMTMFCERAEEL